MSNATFQLALLKIPVSQIERSSKFYQDTLGVTVQFAAEEYGWAQLLAGELPLALYKPGMGGGDGKIGGSLDFHLALAAERFDQLANSLIPRGVIVDNTIHRGDDGTTFIDLRDPDGNTLKIMRADPNNTAV